MPKAHSLREAASPKPGAWRKSFVSG